MFGRATVRGLVAVTVVAFAVVAQAVTIDLVPIGNPGNAADTRYVNTEVRPDVTGFGAVGYAYNIGKYEVTAGQYTEFLNAVAGVDTYSLYCPQMEVTQSGSGITRTGSGTVTSPYTYTVTFPNLPVNFVAYGSAMRFANWLHNGQPTGAQTISTTEDGAYFVNGATTNTALLAVGRKSDWRWAVTSENEWYKAAYHKNDGKTGNYWDYPTRTNSVPYSDNPASLNYPTNSANYWNNDGISGNGVNNGYANNYVVTGSYLTDVGAYSQSLSAYGTLDQGGNVWEWTESIAYGDTRVARGGAWDNNAFNEWGLAASNWDTFSSAHPEWAVGFRVVGIPEPSSITLLLAAGAASLLGYAWRRRRQAA